MSREIQTLVFRRKDGRYFCRFNAAGAAQTAWTLAGAQMFAIGDDGKVLGSEKRKLYVRVRGHLEFQPAEVEVVRRAE